MVELNLDVASLTAAVNELVPTYQRAKVLGTLAIDSMNEADFDEIGLALTGEKRELGLLLYAGAPSQTRPGIWLHVKGEVYDFLCTSSAKYAAERNDGGVTIKQLITIVATAVGSTFNLAVGVVVGAVTVALISALKIGKNAWCAANKLPEIH